MTVTQKKNTRKKAEHKLLLFIICIFLIGAIIGSGVVVVAHAFSRKDTTAAADNQATQPYGTRDGRYITENGGVTFNYELGESFTPIDCDLPVELQEFTYYLCEAYYIDFYFAMGLMYTESSFRTDVVSGTNDYGLMQINECNHAELTEALGITDFTEPYQNIRAGLYILRRLFEKYDEPALVCMAYNMGEYGASTLWDKGVYETTYSNKVLAKADEYAAAALADVNE